MSDLTERVTKAMLAAEENGFEFFDGAKYAPLQVASDIIDHDADFENEDLLEVCDAVHIARINRQPSSN